MQNIFKEFHGVLEKQNTYLKKLVLLCPLIKCQNFEIIILRNRADREKYFVSQVLLKLKFVQFLFYVLKTNPSKFIDFI